MKNSSWITLGISSIIMLVFGITVLFIKDDAVLALARSIGFLILAAGIILLIMAILNRQKKDVPFTTFMIIAVAAIVLGSFIAFFTTQSLTLFLVLFGIWLVIIGLVELFILLRHKMAPNQRNVFIFSGLLTIILGIILFFDPFSGPRILVVTSAIIAIVAGGGNAYSAWIIRSLPSSAVKD